MVKVKIDKCTGCGQCVLVCPAEAIRSWGLAEINLEKCTGCQVCIDYCPVDALEVAE